jgi:O-antigen/teichoic acid export membrane protein
MRTTRTGIAPASELARTPNLHPPELRSPCLPAPRLPSAVRAMSQFGGGAITSGLLTAAATKVIAATLGPSGLAVLSTLQQWCETALVVATLNGQTAVVQGASGLAGTPRREFLRTCILLFGIATLLVALVLLLGSGRAAQMSGLGSDRAPLLRWLAVAVVLGSAYVFLNGMLNALGAVGTLAGLQMVAPAALALLAYPVAAGASRGAERLLPVWLASSVAAAVVAVVVALASHQPELRNWFSGPGRWLTYGAARHFFLLSGSMLASGLAANWALVVVRAHILRAQGLTVTGQFDASWAIGSSLSTLLLGSIQGYYLPLLARARTPAERSVHIAAVLRVAIPAAVVIIVGMAALKPFVLRWLYSPAFEPAAAFLRWTLLGDYLKITSWILSVPMLACSDAQVFLTAELAAWGVLAVGTLALAKWLPLAESASVSFVLMYAVHLAISSAYIRRQRLRWNRIGPVWLAGLGLVLAASVTHWSGPTSPVFMQWWSACVWMGAAMGILATLLRRSGPECAE